MTTNPDSPSLSLIKIYNCVFGFHLGLCLIERERERKIVINKKFKKNCLNKKKRKKENTTIIITGHFSLQFSSSYNESHIRMIESESLCGRSYGGCTPTCHVQLLLIRPYTGKPAGTFSDRPIFNAQKAIYHKRENKGMIESHCVCNNIYDSCQLALTYVTFFFLFCIGRFVGKNEFTKFSGWIFSCLTLLLI